MECVGACFSYTYNIQHIAYVWCLIYQCALYWYAINMLIHAWDVFLLWLTRQLYARASCVSPLIYVVYIWCVTTVALALGIRYKGDLFCSKRILHVCYLRNEYSNIIIIIQYVVFFINHFFNSHFIVKNIVLYCCVYVCRSLFFVLCIVYVYLCCIAYVYKHL